MNATTFFRNRGGNGTVNLNRLNDSVTLPVGRYCCVVPDDTDVMIWACANICELTISIYDTSVTASVCYSSVCLTAVDILMI